MFEVLSVTISEPGRPVTASMAAAPASKMNYNHVKLDVKPRLSGKSRSIQDKSIFACSYFSTILLTLTTFVPISEMI